MLIENIKSIEIICLSYEMKQNLLIQYINKFKQLGFVMDYRISIFL